MSLPRRKTHEEYIRELKEKGIQAEVLEPYQGSMTKIKHLWKVCGHVTEVVPNKILRGIRCGKCPQQRNTRKTHAQYLEELKKKDIQVEPLEYYVNGRTKIPHLWRCGHVTNVLPSHVLLGRGCGRCAKEQSIERFADIGPKAGEKKLLKAAKEIDGRVVEVHGNAVRRDPKTPYITSNTKISWLCEKGHSWEAIPSNIKSGRGCPRCANGNTKGETYTRELLEEYGIEFQYQKKFPDLIRVNHLSYDFYIPSMNILIECQGQQHYEPIEVMGGVEKFSLQQERDHLKREYARQNGYLLLEISYKDYHKNRITEILQEAGILPDLIIT